MDFHLSQTSFPVQTLQTTLDKTSIDITAMVGMHV